MTLTIGGAEDEFASLNAVDFANNGDKLSFKLGKLGSIDEWVGLLRHLVLNVCHFLFLIIIVACSL